MRVGVKMRACKLLYCTGIWYLHVVLYCLDCRLSLNISLDLTRSPIDINVDRRLPFTPCDKDRRGRQKTTHRLQRNARGLWEEEVEEQGISHLADDEEDTISPSNGRQSDESHVSHHSAECGCHHSGERDALDTRCGVDDFGGMAYDKVPEAQKQKWKTRALAAMNAL